MLVVALALAVLCSQVGDTVAQKNAETASCKPAPSGDAGDNPNCQTKTNYNFEATGPSRTALDVEPSQWLSLISDVPQQRSQRGGERRGSEQIRRRPWAEQISTEELMEFLEKHESKLAAKLKDLHQQDPQNFSELPLVVAMKELYGPVIRQMSRDPEGGKLSLEKIRLRLRIERSIFIVKRADSRRAYHEARKELAGYVSELFDVILTQEEAGLKRMEEWLKIRSESDKEQQAAERTARRGGQRDPRSRGGLERLRGEVETKKRAIPAWKKNKDKIVEERVEELLQDHPNFPWGY